MEQNKGQWQPGQSGNPHGRPRRGTTFTDALRGAGTAEELAALAWNAARNGEPWAVQLIFNRLEPPTTNLNIGTEKNDGYDLSKLSPDELKQFIELAERATGTAQLIENDASET